MDQAPLNIVTGAFGTSGQAITRRLLAMGEQVKTLTGHPDRPDPFGGRVQPMPFHFDKPAELARSVKGATTLYNTYWVRLAYRGKTYEQAVRNTQTLFCAAKEAGVRRVVHLSITRPDPDSPLPYFKGKAILERSLIESGLSYTIIRPTVIFGPNCILLNNIAWFLRHLPLFAIPGSGEYRLQPIYLQDLAEIAVRAGHRQDNVILDAVGPETYTYRDLVRLIAKTIGSRALLLPVPPGLALVLAAILGWIVRDVVLTKEEIAGLMAGLLVSDDPPTGKTSLRAWLRQNAATIGQEYYSEVARHYRR